MLQSSNLAGVRGGIDDASVDLAVKDRRRIVQLQGFDLTPRTSEQVSLQSQLSRIGRQEARERESMATFGHSATLHLEVTCLALRVSFSSHSCLTLIIL